MPPRKPDPDKGKFSMEDMDVEAVIVRRDRGRIVLDLGPVCPATASVWLYKAYELAYAMAEECVIDGRY